MVLLKGLRPLHVATLVVVVRILSVFLVQTWYVPDEYWQTLEVAHKQAFGYGALTWEWQRGIRSYLYPTVVAGLYAVLNLTGLDYPEAVVLLPRLLQALISSVADYSFYKWSGGRKWALFLVLTSWFWFYTSGRTLLQTLETALVTIALSVFPFKDGTLARYEKESNAWVWLACVSVFVRPTSLPLWAVLVVYNLLSTNQPRLRLLLRTYLPIGLVTSAALVGLDSYWHGGLVVTPYEFFRFNVLHDISSFYGRHPWHWYLTCGLPAVLGITLVPALAGVYSAVRRPSEHRAAVVLLAAAALHVAAHSFIGHKEFRFVLPLLPIFLYAAQDAIVRWSRKAHNWQLYSAAVVLLAGNLLPAVYFGLVHQAGTTRVMPAIRDLVHDNRTSVAFLMPCHSTPLYSHLHRNITTRYLDCTPPFNKIGETHESELFFHNPPRWWRAEHQRKQTPSLVVMFSRLQGRLQEVLGGYKQVLELPHTQFPEGEVGEKVLVFQKNPQTSADGTV